MTCSSAASPEEYRLALRVRSGLPSHTPNTRREPRYLGSMAEGAEYPAKTCEIDRLVRHKRLVDAALDGRKTEQRRDGIYGYPGETFELKGRSFEIVALTHDRLGDMSEADAQAEGYATLDDYRDLILKMHRGMQWDEDHRVWVHRFRPRD